MFKDILRRHGQPLARVIVLGAMLASVLPAAAQQAPMAVPDSPLRQPPAAMLGSPLRPGPWAPQNESMPQPAAPPAAARSLLAQPSSIMHRIQGLNEHLEMTVNSSRILTMEQKIPQVQVNNPDILDLAPLSPNQVQVAAKKPGVTQINLWGENKQIYTIDVTVTGDARELATILRTNFPKTVLTVVPVGGSVMISGYVDQPDQVSRIIRVAEEYYPKVINNITVSGVQQVLLHVKVMEVSRTKLRRLGFDFAKMNGNNLFISQVSGLITSVTGGTLSTGGAPTVMFQVGNANSAFFGVLDALRQDSLAKILAEPNLVTISGRPAHFHVGGEFLYQINGGITGPSVESKDYGTTIDVVPIVMGNGRIRLEVRPSVSEIDESFSVGGIPALKIREVETGVEMKAGQTLAIAGLVQNLVDSQNSGLPWVSEVPYAGVLFRHVQEQINEVETLIIVTPELVEAMDASQVPPCGPGMDSASPNDWELFFKGHLEVPVCGPPGAVNACMLGSQPTAPPPAGSPAPAAGNAAPLPAPLPPSAPNATAAAGPYNSYTSSQATNSPPLRPEGHSEEPAFIGPIGYDAVN